MKDHEIAELLLSKEVEITNKIHNAVGDILRLGTDSERGKNIIPDLIESIEYTLSDITRIVNR